MASARVDLGYDGVVVNRALFCCAAIACVACVAPRRAKVAGEDEAYAALPRSCRPKLDPVLAVRMSKSEAPSFWVYVSFASVPRGSMWEPWDRERFASCTGLDCVAFASRDRIAKLCDDGNVQGIELLPDR